MAALRSTPNRIDSAAAGPQRWLLLAAALLAIWMLAFFVQLLNESVQRGESLRQQQKMVGQAAPAAQRHAAFDRVAVTRSAGGAQDRVLLASQR